MRMREWTCLFGELLLTRLNTRCRVALKWEIAKAELLQVIINRLEETGCHGILLAPNHPEMSSSQASEGDP